MNAPICCPKCPQQISVPVDGRLPPWCPRCGESLRQPSVPAPASTAIAERPLGPTPYANPNGCEALETSPRVPFFLGCVPDFGNDNHHIYRFYVTDSDVLAFKCGIGTVALGQITPRMQSRVRLRGFSLMHLVMHAFAKAREGRELRLADRIHDLDRADEDGLRDLAAQGDQSFILGPEELQWLRIDPPFGWYRFWYSADHEAVLKFAHRRTGKMVLTLPSLRDARLAIEELPRLFGQAVQVNVGWGVASATLAGGE